MLEFNFFLVFPFTRQRGKINSAPSSIMKNNKKKRRQRIRKMSQFLLISLFFSTPFTHKKHSQSNLLFHFSSSKLRNFELASSYRCEIDVLFRLFLSFSLGITQHDLCVNKEFALGFIPVLLGGKKDLKYLNGSLEGKRYELKSGAF